MSKSNSKRSGSPLQSTRSPPVPPSPFILPQPSTSTPPQIVDHSNTDPLLLLSSTSANSAYTLPSLPGVDLQGGFNGNGREGDVVVGFGGGGGGLGGSGDGQTGEGEANASGGGCEQEEGKEGKKKVKGPPRTSRACLHCRKQKMRCEESQNPPCKRCRNAGVECVFERRSDYLLNPQDSAWQTKIEGRLDTLTNTLEAVLGALESRGIALNIKPVEAQPGA